MAALRTTFQIRVFPSTKEFLIFSVRGLNRIAIVIPCHRVIATDGTLGGYGGGLERKRWLIEHEKGGAGAGLPRQAALPFAAGRV